MSPVSTTDPDQTARGRTLSGLMDGLAELTGGPVAEAFAAAVGEDPEVTRYQPISPNVPAIWHERRPSRNDFADTGHDRTELYIAVILALKHEDGDTEGALLERAVDAAEDIYRRTLRARHPLIHEARIVNLEPPTPTTIGGIALLTSGIVLRARLLKPNR